jgi:hypothetical protein
VLPQTVSRRLARFRACEAEDQVEVVVGIDGHVRRCPLSARYENRTTCWSGMFAKRCPSMPEYFAQATTLPGIGGRVSADSAGCRREHTRRQLRRRLSNASERSQAVRCRGVTGGCRALPCWVLAGFDRCDQEFGTVGVCRRSFSKGQRPPPTAISAGTERLMLAGRWRRQVPRGQ